MRIYFPLFFLYFFSSNLTAQNSIIDEHLLTFIEEDQKIDCIIQFKNTKHIPNTNGLTKARKGKLIYNTLIENTTQSQYSTIQYLLQNNIAYKSYIIANAINGKFTKAQLTDISRLDNVIRISHNKASKTLDYFEEPTMHRGGEAEWGIINIKADSVWQLGFEGENVILAGQDTGVDWDNNLISSKYRGDNGSKVDHNYNWHDAIREISVLHQDSIIEESNNPCGFNTIIPCDDHGHGSHTIGTMVGSDSTNTIGVAPKAKWIACRNMERGYGKPSTYLECFEWFLAPTDTNDENPNTDLAPDVINNSWSCPEMEGCNASNWDILNTAIENLKSAGIMVVVSAGNSGPECSTIDRPAAMFEHSFTVGATNQVDTITNFSARGPIIVDGSFRTKPNVCAPGFQVKSIYLNDEFRTWNGTSMAGPHVAGAAALIISANPSLRGNVEAIETILETTAKPMEGDLCLGDEQGTFPNNTYGYGKIDVLAAVEMALSLSSNPNIQTNDAINIYPNPVSHELNLTADFDFDATFNVFNTNGKLIYSSTVQNNAIVDLNSLSTGSYVYQIVSNKVNVVGKLIKAY